MLTGGRRKCWLTDEPKGAIGTEEGVDEGTEGGAESSQAAGGTE